MKTKKRKLNKNGKILVCVIGIVLILFIIGFFSNYKLKSLHYSNKFIKMAKTENIDEKVKDANKYSKTLEEMLLTGHYDDTFFDTYLDVDYKEDSNITDTLNLLLILGYNADDANEIYAKLTPSEVLEVTSLEYAKDISNFLEYDFFVADNTYKYQVYKDKTSLDDKTTVVNVNIGLDHDFYTEIKQITNPDDTLVLVNKYNQLSNDYEPSDLVTLSTKCAYDNKQVKSIVNDDFMKLCDDLADKGGKLIAYSAYRSYEVQTGLYNNYVRADGKAKADTYSARPGHSEHQTGLALDVSIDNFTGSSVVNSPLYDWFFENVHNYGFIIRYEEEKTDITGYTYEPWHIRYVGKELATTLKNQGLTYDEYYAMNMMK